MFLSATFDVTRVFPHKNESPFEYWVSFSPMAPVFGVNWRFADAVFEPFAPTPEAKPRPAAKKAAKPKPAQIKPDAEEAVVVAPKVAAPVPAKPAPAPKAPTPKAEVVSKAAPAPKPEPKTEPVTPDDLTAIKGIGPKMAEKLNAKGVTTYAQIAKWTKAKVTKMDAELGGIPGAIERSDWVGQAKTLAG